jgi:hypothetical protein
MLRFIKATLCCGIATLLLLITANRLPGRVDRAGLCFVTSD